MKTYIICYDLIGPRRDYEALFQAIKSHAKWARITESNWAIVTNKSAKQIRDDLKSVMDSDDRLFVVKSGVEAAWSNSRCKNSWLKENL